MDIKHLITFRTVAALNSFSRAATALGYVQSTITTHIQALEADLGVPLFNRLGKTIELTEAGKRLLGYSERLLALADETRLAVTNSQLEALSIGAAESIATYRLPSVVKAFCRVVPNVNLSFRPLTRTQIFKSLKEGTVDFAFLIEPLVADLPHLVIEPLVEEPLVVIAAPTHRPITQVSELVGETLLMTERTCGYRGLFEHALTIAGVSLTNTLEFNSIAALKQCAMAGIGVGFLPRVAVAHELANGQLVSLDVVHLSVWTQVTWHKDRWLSPVMTAFLDCVRKVVEHEYMGRPAR